MNSAEFENKMRDVYKNTGLLFGKYKFKVIPNEPHVSSWIEKDGYWESYVSSRICNLFSHINPKTCVDIGANVGYYSFLYHYLGAKKVYAFEPVRENYSVLLSNVIENNLSDEIICVKKAIMDTFGEVIIYTDSGLPSSHVFGGLSGERVQSVSLDEFFYESSDFPEFVKIDAEGAEYKIISGMQNILSSDSLKALHVEIAVNRGYDVEELFGIISQHFAFSFDMLSGTSGKEAVRTRSFMDILFLKQDYRI